MWSSMHQVRLSNTLREQPSKWKCQIFELVPVDFSLGLIESFLQVFSAFAPRGHLTTSLDNFTQGVKCAKRHRILKSSYLMISGEYLLGNSDDLLYHHPLSAQLNVQKDSFIIGQCMHKHSILSCDELKWFEVPSSPKSSTDQLLRRLAEKACSVFSKPFVLFGETRVSFGEWSTP